MLQKLVFVANEIGNFRHHRAHLVQVAREMGFYPILLAAPIGETEGVECEFRAIMIERFRWAPILDSRLFLTILWLLVKERPKVIHLINIKPYLYGGLAARLARVLGWKGGVVITVAGLGRIYDRSGRQKLPVVLRRKFVELLVRHATKGARVTFETAHDRDFWLTRGLVMADQSVITRGAGINLSQFKHQRSVQEGTRLKVLFASRLLRSKGLDVFLNAASLIEDCNIEMLVAGPVDNDPDAVPLGELCAHRNVTYLGPVQDMSGLLSEVDLVVLPSRYNEGVPRILIEAAASGCVPIATRFSGSEAVIKDGETGFFLHSRTIEDQAVELSVLIRDVRKGGNAHRAIGDMAATHIRVNGFAAQDVAQVFRSLYGLDSSALTVRS